MSNKVLGALWRDAQKMGRGFTETLKTTETAQTTAETATRVSEGVRQHLQDVKAANNAIAAKEAEENSYENVLKRKINYCEEELAAMSRTLDHFAAQEAEKAKAAEAKKAAKAALKGSGPIAKFFKPFTDDLKTLGKALAEGWKKTNMGKALEASVLAPIRNHLRTVKQANDAEAAKNEEVHGFEASTKRAIHFKSQEIAELYVKLQDYQQVQAEMAEQKAAADLAQDLGQQEPEAEESVSEVKAEDKAPELTTAGVPVERLVP